ncbi:MAG: hypothetical protein ABSB19_17695 [Methylomonas sp.]|jgi:hypothetical protein
MDAEQRKTVIINRQFGVDYQGLWLSNTKWFDAASFGLAKSDSLANQFQTPKNYEHKLSQGFTHPNLYHFLYTPGICL